MSKLTLLGSMKQMALSALIFGVALTSCGKKDGEGQMQQSAPAVGVVTVKKSNAVFGSCFLINRGNVSLQNTAGYEKLVCNFLISVFGADQFFKYLLLPWRKAIILAVSV